ncbi:MAG: U32 family peptidase, partial [Firmicutes bacterium]|nr:U32 family peptidase [Bacillota bacterium]
GLGSLLRQYVPAMELHLSTQGTVYDLDGVLQAKEMGFERVVLARETPFEQIKAIARATDVPLEIFVHGALCMCYSGQCQMSRFQGGRSGNRGGCAQPCRLPYEILRGEKPVLDKGEKRAVFSKYRLSPKDMCTIDNLGEFAEAGVASLKIEGRMKSPEYVAVVVGIYRKYLDLYARDGWYEVSREDREALQQIFNRGSFTDGYLWKNPRRTILSGDIPKHQGIELGKVLDVRVAGEGRTIRQFLTVKLSRDLNLGDGVEIHSLGRDGEVKLTGNIVTYIGEKKNRSGKSLREARRGQIVEIGDIPGQVDPGDVIFKISDKNQMTEARKTFEITSGTAKKESRKLPVDMELSMHLGKPVRLTATLAGSDLGVIALSEQEPEPALNRPMDEAGARRQLEKTGDTMFTLNALILDMEPGLTIRASALNQLRREALELLTEAWDQYQEEGITTEAFEELDLTDILGVETAQGTAASGGKKALYMFRADEEILELALGSAYDRFYFSYQVFLNESYRPWLKGLVDDGKEVVAWIPPITQGREHAYIDDHRQEICDALKAVGAAALAVNNLGQIRQFENCGIPLFGDYGLNLYNSADFRWAKSQGLSGAVLCHEGFDNGFGKGMTPEESAGFGGPPEVLPQLDGMDGEVVIGGRIPLMISAHCPIGDATGCRGPVDGVGACDGGCYALKDRKGRKYPILTEKMDCRTIIFSQEFPADEKSVSKDWKKKGYHTRVYGIDKTVF